MPGILGRHVVISGLAGAAKKTARLGIGLPNADLEAQLDEFMGGGQPGDSCAEDGYPWIVHPIRIAYPK